MEVDLLLQRNLTPCRHLHPYRQIDTVEARIGSGNKRYVAEYGILTINCLLVGVDA